MKTSFHYADDDTSVLSHIFLKFPPEDQSLLSVGSREVENNDLFPSATFYDVTGGRITIDGKDVRTLTLKSLRNHISALYNKTYICFRERFATTSPAETGRVG